ALRPAAYVVALSHPGVASGKATRMVSMQQRPSQRGWNRSRAGPHVHYLSGCVVIHHHTARIARQPLGDTQPSRFVHPGRLLTLASAVEPAPAPYDPLHLGRGPRPPDRQEAALGLRSRNPGQSANLGVGEIASPERLGEHGQRPERSRHPHSLPGGTELQVRAPCEPFRAGAEAGVPPLPSVELADQNQEPSRRDLQMSGQLGDRITQSIQLRDRLRGVLERERDGGFHDKSSSSWENSNPSPSRGREAPRQGRGRRPPSLGEDRFAIPSPGRKTRSSHPAEPPRLIERSTAEDVSRRKAPSGQSSSSRAKIRRLRRRSRSIRTSAVALVSRRDSPEIKASGPSANRSESSAERPMPSRIRTISTRLSS